MDLTWHVADVNTFHEAAARQQPSLLASQLMLHLLRSMATQQALHSSHRNLHQVDATYVTHI